MGVKSVNDDNELMIITTEGIIIRTPVREVSVSGRITSGVKLINMADDITIASIAKVRETPEEEAEEEESDNKS